MNTSLESGAKKSKNQPTRLLRCLQTRLFHKLSDLKGLFWMLFDVETLVADELVKSKPGQGDATAAVFPAGPRQIGTGVVGAVDEDGAGFDAGS